LSDVGSAAAKAFWIASDLAEEMGPIYARFRHALPASNGDESWVLPIPATYVIDRDGTVALGFVDVDYRNRLEPAQTIAALHAIAKESKVS
jgi:peroxiredoxin